MSDISLTTQQEALQLAKTIDIPDWATHVAVRYDQGKVEPAVWSDEYGAYLDESLEGNKLFSWGSTFNTEYWTFVRIDQIKTHGEQNMSNPNEIERRQAMSLDDVFVEDEGIYEVCDIDFTQLPTVEWNNLSFAHMEFANCDFSGRVFECKGLRNTSFTDCNMTGCKFVGRFEPQEGYMPEFISSCLVDADFTQTMLTGDFTGADLTNAKIILIDYAHVAIDDTIVAGTVLADYEDPELLQQIAKMVLDSPDRLDMGDWHTCSTVHCIAGWACHLSPAGKALEASFGPSGAGALLLGREAERHFLDSDEDALCWLRSILIEEEPNNECK